MYTGLWESTLNDNTCEVLEEQDSAEGELNGRVWESWKLMHLHQNSGTWMALPKEGERPWVGLPLTHTTAGVISAISLKEESGRYSTTSTTISPPEVSPYVYAIRITFRWVYFTRYDFYLVYPYEIKYSLKSEQYVTFHLMDIQ